MPNYVIGVIGQSPRMIFSAPDLTTAQVQIKSGEVCFLAPSPPINPPCQISSDGTALVAQTVPLSVIQAAKWTSAKQYRQTKVTGGLTTAKGVVQTDAESQRRIFQFADSATRFKLNNQASMLGLFKLTSGSWSVNFVMKDNTIVAHNGDDMIAMAEALNTFLTGCQTASQSIRTAIFAATTVNAVAAIDVTAGYPNG